MTDEYKALESQIREIYGRVVYAHKTHEKCADILKYRSDGLKFVEVALSALTTTSILGVLFGTGKTFEIVAAVFATASLFLTLYAKDFDYLAIAEKHKQSALDILDIRERFLSLLVDIKIGNKSIDELQATRDALNADLVSTYRGAPKTISKGYQKAVKALKNNEEFTFTDAEIDCFLPATLRRS
ncbi:SLATT domain-containing protein (plasmid) [Mucilaginibacter robiniae]|uniref:SLATT domain-containing protein n=1 Tax=Mucilaginibacter robiniae TaxID=2728022 RepID=A0A7L5E6B1_9SPHI|nr:SLATT domain-containing protein [Mucilaginibacter robiniae]QJD98575.1 SLATT domain-containing protein [Mucilaginibacter robiniae]